MDIAVLFDLDGTLIDTEHQYSDFWANQCIKYQYDESVGLKMKGSTLKQIMTTFFSREDIDPQNVLNDLKVLETNMDYSYISGAIEFIKTLRINGIKTALVTSSDINKMNYVYKAHPDFKTYFDAILIAGDYEKSKPDPECFLTAAESLGIEPKNCYVFEDSHFGLQAARRAGMKVIGLSTTLPVAEIADECDYIIKDFLEIQVDDLNSI